MPYPQLTKEESDKAHEDNAIWKKKAVYWHNAIPIFNYDIRHSLTNDVQLVTNIKQLELNEKLYAGIQWNNWINIIVSAINLFLLIVNIVLLVKG